MEIETNLDKLFDFFNICNKIDFEEELIEILNYVIPLV